MAAPQDVVRVCRDGATLTFQPEGRSCVKQGLSVRRHAERCLADGVSAVRVDLRRCIYMDSTFLGTLLFLMRAVSRHSAGTFALISPTPQCAQLLKQMCLDQVFPIHSEEETAGCTWQALPCDPEDLCAFKDNVVQAHHELANLPGPAGEQFREVAQCLKREVGPGTGGKA